MEKEITLRNRKITVVGGSMGFIVPMPIIRNEGFNKEKTYNLTIKEVAFMCFNHVSLGISY